MCGSSHAEVASAPATNDARPGRWQATAFDLALLDRTEVRSEPPAIKIWAPLYRGELEPRLESGENRAQRVEVRLSVGYDGGRVDVVHIDGGALRQPPTRCGHVEARDIELVDHEMSTGANHGSQVPARFVEGFYVVQGHDREGTIEALGERVELVQRHRLHLRCATRWVDRSDVVPATAQMLGELAGARAHFQHAGRRPRQRIQDKGDKAVVDHVPREGKGRDRPRRRGLGVQSCSAAGVTAMGAFSS